MDQNELIFKLIGMLTGHDEIDLALVERGLRSADNPTVLKALKVLQDNYSADLSEPVLRLFLSGTDEIWPKAEQVLLQDPLLLFEPRQTARSAGSGQRSAAQPAKNHLESFFLKPRIEKLSATVKEFVDLGDKATLARLARLPGIENLLLERIFLNAGPEAMNVLRRRSTTENMAKFPPQISIIPSYACNLNCEYCFAKAMIKNHGTDMNAAFFQQIMDTVAAEGQVKLVNFLGGEPTQFKELDQFAAATEKLGLKYYLATNGLAARERFSRISAGKNLVSLTFHIEKDEFYTPEQVALLLANVQAVADRPIHLAIRYNLTDPERNDWSFMKKYFDALPTFSFSFAVAFPDINSHGKADAFLQLKKFQKKIVGLINYVNGFRTNKEIKIAWSKPYPLCYFTAPELRRVIRLSNVKNICEIHRNQFTNNLCITPAAYAIPCMALDAPHFRIKDLSSHEQLAQASENKVSKMVQRGFAENCGSCILYQMGNCQAACFTYCG